MLSNFSRLLIRWYRFSLSYDQESLSAANAMCSCVMALACLCTNACKSGLPGKAEPLGDMTRLDVDVKGSMFWKGGEILGASASLEVRSKAMGGDLARFGTCAGGVPARGGEVAEEEVARDMVVPGGSEDHPAYARLASEASDARAGVEFQ